MIGLVACCKMKAGFACAARELYLSPLFKMSLAYAEVRCSEVYVISALAGLLPLHRNLSPYNVTLADLTPKQRRQWGVRVLESLVVRYPDGDRVLLLAGELYAKPIKDAAELALAAGAQFEFEEPLAGMQIGERLSFLSRFVKEAA